MPTTAEAVLNRARRELGVEESPHGSNNVMYARWYGISGPWCAMFLSWVFYHEGLPLPASTEKGFAYTPSGANWFKKIGRWSETPQVGAVVFYDFPNDGVNRISHVGIVESINPDGSIVAIEGNTDEAGGRTGGKVMRRARKVGIVGYGIPDFESAGPPPPPPTPPPVDHRKERIRQLQGHIGTDNDGIWGPNTEAACKRNYVGWERAVREKGGNPAVLRGNKNRGLVRWLQEQGRRRNYNMDVDGNPNGPQTNHLIVVVLGQSDSICGPRGFRNAVD